VALQLDIEPVAETLLQRSQAAFGQAFIAILSAMSIGPVDAPVSAIIPSLPPLQPGALDMEPSRALAAEIGPADEIDSRNSRRRSRPAARSTAAFRAAAGRLPRSSLGVLFQIDRELAADDRLQAIVHRLLENSSAANRLLVSVMAMSPAAERSASGLPR
jgi:hypothetical protein